MDALEAVLEARAKTARIDTDPKTFFVHVRVPEHVASRLREVQRRVLPDSDGHQEIDHVTLVYTRKPEVDHSPEKVHGALASLRALGQRTGPIDARIQGWAYFDGASKNGEPRTALVALLDAPGLEHLHVDAARVLAEHGVEASKTHVFTPHITLGYLPQHGRTKAHLEPIDATFSIDTIHVAARDVHEIPLEGIRDAPRKAAELVPSALHGALVGAGIGAGAGLVGSAVDYAHDSPLAQEQKPLWKRMMINSGMGAVGGGVTGAMHRMTSTSTGAAADLVDSLDQQRFASMRQVVRNAVRKS